MMEKQEGKRARGGSDGVYEDVWKEVYLAGTEWDQLADVNKVAWEFDHLDEAVSAGGDVEALRSSMNAHIYLFGSSEPQLLSTDVNPQGEVLPIPVIVALVSELAPPSTLGIKSVQRAEEEIVPMSSMKMGWYPCVPLESAGRRRGPKVHVSALKCERRRANLRVMKEDDVRRYDYVLPYILFPHKQEDEQVDTVVNIMVDTDALLPAKISKPLVFEFDWEMDELDEFVQQKIEEEELDAASCEEPLKAVIQAQVKATKAKYKAERDARRARTDAISQAEKDSLSRMRVIKFYPINTQPDISACKTKYINRYYGHAHEVR
ncbi:hypothetical protein FVE85_6893 [Porphyridium purpureum]|uniref:Uncharacterized protein n=1 Tax=Porphyridium purpureum TaxID=35688 RepID=A0A5J4Z828_PORPP|nr:hypothetical protein FVE85_6893 [Porphyridium purpureum]|eukprot:POR4637..scf295_1